MNVEGKRVHRG